LLRTVCDCFLLGADGRASPCAGAVDAYGAWLMARRDAQAAGTAEPDIAAQREQRKAQRDTAAADRQQKLARRRPLVKEAGQLETKLARLQKERMDLEARLADSTYYATASQADVQATSRRCSDLIAQIGELEERWLEIHAELEQIGEVG
jgi:ATP-binding cassette subfamily F protein 3